MKHSVGKYKIVNILMKYISANYPKQSREWLQMLSIESNVSGYLRNNINYSFVLFVWLC